MSPSPILSPLLSSSPVPYPGFEGIIPGHVIQQGGQRVYLQINTAHLLPGLEGQGSEDPSQSSIPTPSHQGREEEKVRGKDLPLLPLGVSLSSCPSQASIPVVGAGLGPPALPPPPVEVVGKERSPPPEVQGETVPRWGEGEEGRHLPGCPPRRLHPQGGEGAVREGLN